MHNHLVRSMLSAMACVVLSPLNPVADVEAKKDAADKSSIYLPSPGDHSRDVTAMQPVNAAPGPHLFIDDELIASSHNLARRVRQPSRDASIPNPIVSGKEDGCYQPYFSVVRDLENNRFRLWFGVPMHEPHENSRSHVAYMESDDGLHWKRPARVLKDPSPIQFGSDVIDQGPQFKNPEQRYVLSYYFDGLRIAVSPDGLNFKPLLDKPLIKHSHDITNVSWDELRGRYMATVSVMMGHPRFKGERRTTFISYSADLLRWEKPWIILRADDSLDQGETQFYAMNGYLTRGPLRIGMVKILRDDLLSDTRELLDKRGGSGGIGYTTLAWTRDGEHWVRDRDVFLDRGPIGAWDRSHAWVDEQLIVGDEVYLYYAGYRSGHKANRYEERQIGLVKMPLDRYVAREPAQEGHASLVTIPLKMNGAFSGLVLNVRAPDGAIRVRVLERGRPVAGMDFQNGQPVTGDGLRLPVRWGSSSITQQKLTALQGKTAQLEFQLDRASLFSFEFVK